MTLRFVGIRWGYGRVAFRRLSALPADSSPKPIRSHPRYLLSSGRFSTGTIGPGPKRPARGFSPSSFSQGYSRPRRRAGLARNFLSPDFAAAAEYRRKPQARNFRPDRYLSWHAEAG